MQTKPRLFFDIETVSNPDSCALMPEPVIAAPGNYKDPDKIKEYIDRETISRKTEMLDRAALDPDYGKILSIGMSVGDSITVLVNRDIYPRPEDPDGEWDLPIDAMSEESLLRMFWTAFSGCEGRCVGYNILGFDLPYLMRRSMALGVVPPVVPNLAKYRTEPVTDLMQILYGWGSEKYKGLKQVARLYGILNECPDVDGSKVKDLDPDTLRAYQRSDVSMVARLYNLMNGVYFDHGHWVEVVK